VKNEMSWLGGAFEIPPPPPQLTHPAAPPAPPAARQGAGSHPACPQHAEHAGQRARPERAPPRACALGFVMFGVCVRNENVRFVGARWID